MYVISKYHILYKKAASIKNVKKKKIGLIYFEAVTIRLVK